MMLINLSQDGSWGMGAIILNDERAAMAVATWKFDSFSDPLTAEAYALYNTIVLAKDCCFRNRRTLLPRTYTGNIVLRIRQQLRAKWNFWDIKETWDPEREAIIKESIFSHPLDSLSHPMK
ncbi:hypothetical protein L195_g043321 [Trifolium pratense]|uniref:RNase H type-1 domain-containing protein n=1 Tax=Trifolium pratense TaxID=57577 RepID=A0A2K3M8X9_TRIPR|nr:hypothetical protein L195_g043321 [Trifolium pratense]